MVDARPFLACVCLVVSASIPGCASPGSGAAGPNGTGVGAGASAAADWRTTEAPVLSHHVQLTSPDRFVKAGESYFSPDDRRIVFQAIERPTDGTAPGDFYAMFVADVVRDGDGRVSALANVRRISPEGSANTCGWFHPKDPDRVFFGSTVAAPSNRETPGYQRGTGKYRWQFPPEMRIVECDLRTADGTAASLKPVVGDGNGYVAEGSLSADGRTLLYTQVDPKTQGDLWVMDLPTGARRCIVDAPGYDGGPFFTPDDRGIIYRSDRNGDSLLQVYVADLVRDPSGMVIGIANERAMTGNDQVNWCPFYHPDGRHFAYASSEAGHSNYEVFMRDAGDPARVVRLTTAPGADVLPAFSHDGRTMIWTGQRGAGERSSQLWVASFDLGAVAAREPFRPTGAAPDGERGTARP
jgi:TolB protein